MIEQRFRDWELLVVGDACTDDTTEVVAHFRDSRIRFHNLDTNVGEQSGPNNVGVSMARGALLAFLNHDDLRGHVMELLLHEHRPRLAVIPPGVWHGVENMGDVAALIVNVPDRAYDYENPDHWRLPATTREIPYTFRGVATAGSAI